MTTAPEWYVITPITRNQLLNNGCLLKTVHLGGEPVVSIFYHVIKLHTKGRQ